MRHFATESGKSKGQFYTPAEVSRVIAQVIGIGRHPTTSSTTVYDPACGSGSLLLKVADEVSGDVTLYGQEKDDRTTDCFRRSAALTACMVTTRTSALSSITKICLRKLRMRSPCVLPNLIEAQVELNLPFSFRIG